MKDILMKGFYLMTVVNISEDAELNGEFENKLFFSFDKARECLDNCLNIEISAYKEKYIEGYNCEVENISDSSVNLWLNEKHSEAVLYRIREVSPI